MQWETDWELRARMAAVLALLVALLVGFAVALAWVLTTTLGLLVGESLGPLAIRGLSVGSVLVVFAAAAVSELVLSERLTGESGPTTTSGERVTALRKRLARLAQTARAPTPTVALVETETPKAYTTGVRASDAEVVVSTGLLDALDDEELDAVLAHELAHVKNRDAGVMTAASLVEIIGGWILDFRTVFGQPRRSPDSRNDVGVFEAFYYVVIRPVAWLFWWVGRGLTGVLSQYREYAADRGSVAITGSPAALASALATLDRASHEHPATDLRERDKVQMGFNVVPVPAAEDAFDPSEYTGFAVSGESDSLTTAADEAMADLNEKSDVPTHPPTSERIDRLREMNG